MAERSLWVDPPPRRHEPQRPAEPEPEPEPWPDEEPEASVVLFTRRTGIAIATGLVVLSTLLGISGDWFSSGPSVSYLAAWSGAVLAITALALVAAAVRLLLSDRDASLAVGIVALVWVGQIAALLTGFGEEALDVGPGAAGAAAGLPAALALTFDGLATGRAQNIPRWSLVVVGIASGTVLALALTLLPLGDPQTTITIIR